MNLCIHVDVVGPVQHDLSHESERPFWAACVARREAGDPDPDEPPLIADPA
jgi:hypothetical protein